MGNYFTFEIPMIIITKLDRYNTKSIIFGLFKI